MHCSSTALLYRRYNKGSYCSCNTSRTQQFKNTFINTFPSSSTCRKYTKTNLLIPYQIKAPTSSQENIETLRSFFCTERQWSCINKNCCSSLPLENSGHWQSRYPYRNHVTSNSSISTWRIYNTISPEIRSPTNCSVTLKITSKNREQSQNTQRPGQRKRYSWCSLSIFLPIGRPIENQKQNSKAISTCLKSHRHLNLMTISRQTPSTSLRLFQNCILTVIPCLKRPSLQTQRSLQKDCPSLRQRRVSSSRTAHILYIKTCMNNNSSPLKLLRFKAGMCHQVIHCQSIMTHRLPYHHVTQLTTSTVSNNTFYIILYSTHCSSHQSCYSTNQSLNTSTRNTLFPKRISSCNLKNSCCYQCCCMNQSRYWSRPPTAQKHCANGTGIVYCIFIAFSV